MIMQQLTGHGMLLCDHEVKVRENKNSIGDEGHNKVVNSEKRFIVGEGL